MMMGLRLKEGISLARYETRFGESMRVHYEKQINQLIDKGWLEITEARIKCTEKGFPLLNTVLGDLLDE